MFLPLLSNHNSPGSKAAAVEFSNSMYDLGSPISAGPLQVVQLAEDLKLALELQPSQEERDNLRAQLQAETAQALIEWLQSGTVSVSTLFTNGAMCACSERISPDCGGLFFSLAL